MKKIRIKVKRPWIAYPGSSLQQNYAEDLVHGYLLWNIKKVNDFDVKFCELPNPCPFITIVWNGSLDDIFQKAKTLPQGTRYRIYDRGEKCISQQDITILTTTLRQQYNALEVTFKTDRQTSSEVISAGGLNVVKNDLRNPDVIFTFLKDYYSDAKISDEIWQNIHSLSKEYLATCTDHNDSVRNTKWSLKQLKFDNLFSYGENNIIDFENLNGIVGIFGPNRAGKSSIVGTIMYALFNSTDRGSIKNQHIVNTKKSYCNTHMVINVDGVDYAIERQTSKKETKQGQIKANTSLNLYKIEEDGEALDLVGEQRTDTEKLIRLLIGTPEDFTLTSLAAQGEMNQFISQGSSKRYQILSRFLDLDIFYKMHELARNDLTSYKTLIKNYPDRDFDHLKKMNLDQIQIAENLIAEKNTQLVDLQHKINECKNKFELYCDYKPVTQEQIDAQKRRVVTYDNQLILLSQQISACRESIINFQDKIKKINEVTKVEDVTDLKRKFEAYKTLEMTVISLKHLYEKESAILKQQERSLKLLNEVPCGDSFPTCKFIKDAYGDKIKIEPQKDIVSKTLENFNNSSAALNTLNEENIQSKIEKLEKLISLSSTMKVNISNKEVEIVKLEVQLETLSSNLEQAKSKLDEYQKAFNNEENEEIISLRCEIEKITKLVNELDNEKLAIASKRGMLQSDIVKYEHERQQREELYQKLRMHELIVNAFSKKGVPNTIISSQLPLINDEIAKILEGIVNFTIELEVDNENDLMEVYINYGDSRRIIELCSGMEKMIASTAIRVALINISSLPKPNTLIIDEGFGALDDNGVESCNRLLTALKRYFKNIIVITHVDGIKDIADTVLEITKNEDNDAFIVA